MPKQTYLGLYKIIVMMLLCVIQYNVALAVTSPVPTTQYLPAPSTTAATNPLSPPAPPVILCENAAMCVPVSNIPKKPPPLCITCGNPFTVQCASYITCFSAPTPTGSLVISPIREFYEGIKQKSIESINTQTKTIKSTLNQTLALKNEQYTILSGIKNALAGPLSDEKVTSIMNKTQDNGLIDIGCVQCTSLLSLAIKNKEVTEAQSADFLQKCAQKTLEDMVNANNESIGNTTAIENKKCFRATCDAAVTTQAAYSMIAQISLSKVQANMAELFFGGTANLIIPCTDNLNELGKNNPIESIMGLVNGIDTLTQGATGDLGNIAGLLGNIFTKKEMINFGCLGRHLGLLQQLESDRTTIEQYSQHLRSMQQTYDGIQSMCQDPRFSGWR